MFLLGERVVVWSGEPDRTELIVGQRVTSSEGTEAERDGLDVSLPWPSIPPNHLLNTHQGKDQSNREFNED